jgi:hypothetical protein
MNTAEVLIDAFGRIRQLVEKSVEGLSPEDLTYRPDPAANSIAWLTWHLTRIQDDHVGEIVASEQAWTAAGWADRFGLPFDVAATGYGHSSEDVAAVRPQNPDLLIGYHEAVWSNTMTYLGAMGPNDLDRIIDESYDPPVSVGVRLVSVISDNIQHGGQARYVRGMLERR